MIRLEKHDVIGLDLDNTLIEGRNSRLLWQFIKEHPEKKFWIITFRTGLLAKEQTIWDEIRDFSGLDSSWFEGIQTVDEQTYLKANINKSIPNINDYIKWKGKTCKELGCTVLVDDMPEMTKYGCDLYSVDFVDSRTLRI